MRARLSSMVVCAVLSLGASTLARQARADGPAPGAARAADDRIDLQLHRADLRNVLRLLADVGGVNLVVADDVHGEVTLRLRQVRWRDALQAILSLHGLEAELHDDILHVAPAEHFAERRKRALTAREQCLASAPLRTRVIPVSYADADELAAHIRATLSPRGTVSVDRRTNTLVVRDVDCR